LHYKSLTYRGCGAYRLPPANCTKRASHGNASTPPPAIPQVGTEVLKVAEFASVLGVGQIRGGCFSRQEAEILCGRGRSGLR
jgi:hypothetical protein